MDWLPIVRELGALGVLLFVLVRLTRAVDKLAGCVHHIEGVLLGKEKPQEHETTRRRE